MTTTLELPAAASAGPVQHTTTPVVVAVLHPKGGVGRSTTVWQLGAELALRGYSVCIEDLQSLAEYPAAALLSDEFARASYKRSVFREPV